VKVRHRPAHLRPDPGTGIPAAEPPAGEVLPGRLGDAIDDRIAELLDELLDERAAARRRQPAAAIVAAGVILAALTTTVLLKHSPIAWTIWPSSAVICLAAAWAPGSGRTP
jgi:hypothetical protein